MKKLLLVLPLFLAACTTAPMYGDCINDNITSTCIYHNNRGGLSTNKQASPASPSTKPSAPSNPGKPGGSKPGHGKGDGNHHHSGPPGKGKGKGKGKK